MTGLMNMAFREETKAAMEHFGRVVEEQLERAEAMKAAADWTDYGSLDRIVVGVCGGDGIGPFISEHARTVLEDLLSEEIAAGRVEIRTIDGLTIENRVKEMKAVPDAVLDELRDCHVILKGPTTTPKKGDPWPNIESANVAMRRHLDLFANVRPVKIPEKGVDWVFFRENTEGSYALGSKGVHVNDDVSIDFCVTTEQGSERIIRLAFDYAERNGMGKVSVVTKANVVKATDGRFLDVAERVAKDFPAVEWDDWFIDIMTAKLLDPYRAKEFKVMVLPNLYGDILTDEAAQIQGGVGTAGSANIGKRYAMFEAIHGSAPRMVDEGRAQYADPSSMIKAAAMLLAHIGRPEQARRLEMALDVCGQFERRLAMTGRADGASGAEYAEYVLETVKDPTLEERWTRYKDSFSA